MITPLRRAVQAGQRAQPPPWLPLLPQVNDLAATAGAEGV
jgi:hypothetical protein